MLLTEYDGVKNQKWFKPVMLFLIVHVTCWILLLMALVMFLWLISLLPCLNFSKVILTILTMTEGTTVLSTPTRKLLTFSVMTLLILHYPSDVQPGPIVTDSENPKQKRQKDAEQKQKEYSFVKKQVAPLL